VTSKQKEDYKEVRYKVIMCW